MQLNIFGGVQVNDLLEKAIAVLTARFQVFKFYINQQD